MGKTILIEIDVENDAFVENYCLEVVDILEQLVPRLRHWSRSSAQFGWGGDCIKLFDSNGNHVGMYREVAVLEMDQVEHVNKNRDTFRASGHVEQGRGARTVAISQHEDCERPALWDSKLEAYVCMCGKRSSDGTAWRNPVGTVTDNMANVAFDQKMAREKKLSTPKKGKQ